MQRLALLAWPALVAWGMALLFLARPVPTGVFWSLVCYGVLLGVAHDSVLALAYAGAALLDTAPIALRLLACAANLSVLMLVFLHGLGVHALRASTGSMVPVATERCREYYEAATTWALVTGTLPGTLADMEAPLRPYEDSFITVEPDPWGGAYVLSREGDAVHVHSNGPDGKEGTEDDIAWPAGE